MSKVTGKEFVEALRKVAGNRLDLKIACMDPIYDDVSFFTDADDCEVDNNLVLTYYTNQEDLVTVEWFLGEDYDTESYYDFENVLVKHFDPDEYDDDGYGYWDIDSDGGIFYEKEYKGETIILFHLENQVDNSSDDEDEEWDDDDD